MYSDSGEVLVARGRWYGREARTNNEAEVRAMRELVDVLCDMAATGQLLVKYLVVVGDSEMAIRFVTREYKAKKHELAEAVKAVQEQVCGLKGYKVRFQHVLRSSNCVADWLAQVATRYQRDVDWREVLFDITHDLPKPDEVVLLSGAWVWQPEGSVPEGLQ